MPDGLTIREDLQRAIGRFISGEVTGIGGRRLVKFTVDFEVHDADLALLNTLRSGISHCQEILRDQKSKHVFYVQFGTACDQNQMIRLALHYREKVNNHYRRPLVEEAPAAKPRSKRKVTPPTAAYLNFSSPRK